MSVGRPLMLGSPVHSAEAVLVLSVGTERLGQGWLLSHQLACAGPRGVTGLGAEGRRWVAFGCSAPALLGVLEEWTDVAPVNPVAPSRLSSEGTSVAVGKWCPV